MTTDREKTKARGSHVTARAGGLLPDSADLYRILVESVLDYAIFALDVHGRVMSWNAGAERLMGYRATEIIGRHFSTFFPEHDVRSGKPDRELEIATREGHVEDESWRIRKDGSRFWANGVLTALRDLDGDLVGFAKVTRDLTSRRATEEQARRLAAEEAAVRALGKRSAELADLNAQLHKQKLELEAQTRAAHELAAELEATNQQMEETLAEEEESRERAEQAERRAAYQAKVGEVLATSLDYETNMRELARLVVPDLADWCGVDILREDGSIDRVAVAHIDPKMVQMALDLQRRYPPDPNSPVGVPAVLRTGEPQLYSTISDELLATTAVDEEHLGMLRQLQLKSAMIVPLKARGRTLGALTLVASQTGRHFHEGDLSFAIEVARRAGLSVDNARLHSEALEARREAEQAALAKSRFLAVMSHELRTPLNAIGGYAELLSMGLRGPVTDAQRDDLERIRRNQQNLLSLINDVLDFAKLESGRVRYERRTVKVRELLEEMDPLLLPQLREKQLEYDYKACSHESSVCADPVKLRQILLNLMTNAIKFTPTGGSVRVTCSEKDGSTRVAVTDTGIGIQADKLPAVFEPFVQLDRNLDRQQEGTGLGLSISRDLARGMGGDIIAESKVGVGSTFTVVLPSR